MCLLWHVMTIIIDQHKKTCCNSGAMLWCMWQNPQQIFIRWLASVTKQLVSSQRNKIRKQVTVAGQCLHKQKSRGVARSADAAHRQGCPQIKCHRYMLSCLRLHRPRICKNKQYTQHVAWNLANTTVSANYNAQLYTWIHMAPSVQATHAAPFTVLTWCVEQLAHTCRLQLSM